MKIGFLQIIFLFWSTASVGQTFKIVQFPIKWNDERKHLTLDYLEKRHGINTDSFSIVPRMVVVHWTSIDNFFDTYMAFYEPILSGRPEIVNASPLNVSSQYLIDRDGTIYQLLPDTVFARHTIGLNYCAIGIENVGGAKQPLTKQQLLANSFLIRKLSDKYPIEFVLGHHEYELFRNTSWWKETDPNYLTKKIDPGEKFMRKLRRKLKEINLRNLKDIV